MSKKRKGKTGRGAAQRSPQQGILEVLPIELLPVIARDRRLWSTYSNDHPMLGVSRAFRDAVLSSLTGVTLELEEDSSLLPLARLLHRICSQAPPGLDLTLDLPSQGHALPMLLQPGLQCGGWANVTALQVTTSDTWGLNLISVAFPGLSKLELNVDGADLGEELLALLQQCSRLASLTIYSFGIDEAVLVPTSVAAALAQLPALKELALWPADHNSLPAIFAAALSGLTALKVSTTCEHHLQAGIITAAARNPNLQDLRIQTDDAETPTAAQLAHVLAACPLVTSLSLTDTVLNDQGLEAVLTHGPNITKLVARSITTEASFAERACKWESLYVQGDNHPSVLTLARLPLRTVTELSAWGGFLFQLPLELQLPVSRMPAEQLPAILRQAATNMASCPAWPAGFHGSISLKGDPVFSNMTVFDSQQRTQLIEALKPLGGPAVKEVEVSIGSASFQWGRPEVQALARSLGGQVTSLQLGDCSLSADFWMALEECFPALRSLYLKKDVTCSAPDVAMFCSTRPADRRFTMDLTADVYDAVSGEQLQASLAARGMTHVKLMRIAAET